MKTPTGTTGNLNEEGSWGGGGGALWWTIVNKGFAVQFLSPVAIWE